MEFMPSPSETGWYISRANRNWINPIDSMRNCLGPFDTKLMAVNHLKALLKAWNIKFTNNMVYQVERYIVTITLDKNAGSWLAKQDDYAQD